MDDDIDTLLDDYKNKIAYKCGDIKFMPEEETRRSGYVMIVDVSIDRGDHFYEEGNEEGYVPFCYYTVIRVENNSCMSALTTLLYSDMLEKRRDVMIEYVDHENLSAAPLEVF